MEKMEIGKIVRPQGIRGEVKVAGLTDDVRRFLELGEVYVGQSKQPTKVLSARVSAKDAYLTLAGVADRNAAETLRNQPLYIPREEAPPLPEDTYYIADMLGMEVVTEEGRRLGTVKDILQHGAADVYELDNGVLFPFLKDVALVVDLAAKKITVNEKRFGEVAVYED